MNTNRMRDIMDWHTDAAQVSDIERGARLDALTDVARLITAALDELGEQIRENALPGPHHIKGEYCHDCKWLAIESAGRWRCLRPGSPGYRHEVIQGHGCTQGELREAE